jgi:small conductance mechanosensitive channel
MESVNFLNTAIEQSIAYAPKVLLAFATLWIGTWLINRLVDFLNKIMTTSNVDATLRPFFSSIVGVGLKIMLLLSVAGMFGIETTSFIAVLGALAFAVGMALQGSLGNFASGVMVLMFKPYKVGDLVTAAGQTGTVEAIQIFNTVLLTPDNKRIIIPNGQVTSSVITNISGQGEIRVDMTYNVSAIQDIENARSVIHQVADNCSKVLHNKEVDIFVNESPIGMTQFVVRPWTKSEHYWDVYFYMQENIKKAFAKHNIKSPIPALEVVHLNNQVN